MEKQEFVDAVMTGIRFTDEPDFKDITEKLIGQVYDLRKDRSEGLKHIKTIDDNACDYMQIKAKCRCCGDYYQLDYEISQFDYNMSYCGKNEWCTP